MPRFQKKMVPRRTGRKLGSLVARFVSVLQKTIPERHGLLDATAPDDRPAFGRSRLLVHKGLQFRRQRIFLAALRLGEETLKAFDELIAAGELTPALRQLFVIAADGGIGRLSGALLRLGGALQTVRNMPAKFEEQIPLPILLPNYPAGTALGQQQIAGKAIFASVL